MPGLVEGIVFDDNGGAITTGNETGAEETGAGFAWALETSPVD